MGKLAGHASSGRAGRAQGRASGQREDWPYLPPGLGLADGPGEDVADAADRTAGLEEISDQQRDVIRLRHATSIEPTIDSMLTWCCAVDMPTTDLFTLPHKALRSVFGSTATEIGAYDVAEGGSSVAVAALAHEIVEVAHAHGAHEDEFIVPLLARHLPHLEQQLRAEHERLVVTFDSVQCHADIFAGAPSGPA